MTHVTASVEPFLEEDPRHQGRDAEPEVDRLAVAQLLARAPGDDLLGPPGGKFELGDRGPVVARRFGQQDGLRRLELIRCDDDGVDHDARHADACAGSVRPFGEPLDLGDDHAAVVVRGERLVQDAERCALVLAS